MKNKENEIDYIDMEQFKNESKEKKSKIKTFFLKYFKLSIFQICLLSMIITMYIVLSFLSSYIIWPVPTLSFLKIEITYFLFFVLIIFVNLFYTLVSFILLTLIRNLYIPDAAFPVDNIFMIISGISLILLYVFVKWILNFNKKINFFYKELINVIICIILISIFNVLINKWFILDLYAKFLGFDVSSLKKSKILWSGFFPFNLVNLSINLSIFLLMEPILQKLILRYKKPNI